MLGMKRETLLSYFKVMRLIVLFSVQVAPLYLGERSHDAEHEPPLPYLLQRPQVRYELQRACEL